MPDKCAGCSGNCNYEKLNEKSDVKYVIGVISGKGGVGKSLVTSMLAVKFAREGYNVGILDADVTGPSIPKIFGINADVMADGNYLVPPRTKTGIDIMSVNLLLDDVTKPVVWRGPIISGTVKQFWTDVIWDKKDILFVDCPPGTGDVPLTVFQSLPLSGVIIIGSPQELVSMIVAKAVNMAKMMDIPALGVIENMSFFKCPSCGKEYKIFGESHIESVSADMGIPLLAKIPMDPVLSVLCDKGSIESMNNDYLDGVPEKLLRRILNA